MKPGGEHRRAGSETGVQNSAHAASAYLGPAACRPCHRGRPPPPPGGRGSPSPWTPGCTADSRSFHECSASRSGSRRRAQHWEVKQAGSAERCERQLRATKCQSSGETVKTLNYWKNLVLSVGKKKSIPALKTINCPIVLHLILSKTVPVFFFFLLLTSFSI